MIVEDCCDGIVKPTACSTLPPHCIAQSTHAPRHSPSPSWQVPRPFAPAVATLFCLRADPDQSCTTTVLDNRALVAALLAVGETAILLTLSLQPY